MSDFHLAAPLSVPDLLTANIPLSLISAINDNLLAGSERAFRSAQGMDEGHLPHVVGQLRHFEMNQSFHRALHFGEALPSPIRGNDLVIGRMGIFYLARFNAREDFWRNGRRSLRRRELSGHNAELELLVNGDLFGSYQEPKRPVVFFIGSFPVSGPVIRIAVPDSAMKNLLFNETLDAFALRYQAAAAAQEDNALPKLKKRIPNTESEEHQA